MRNEGITGDENAIFSYQKRFDFLTFVRFQIGSGPPAKLKILGLNLSQV